MTLLFAKSYKIDAPRSSLTLHQQFGHSVCTSAYTVTMHSGRADMSENERGDITGKDATLHSCDS